MHIPGVLTVFEPDPARALPVLVDSPHSGRDYPARFALDFPMSYLEAREDRFVDRLLENFPDLGARVLLAQSPRVYIDLNRARDDIHPRILSDEWAGAPLKPTKYSLDGIGLIHEQLNKKQIYMGGLSSAEVQARITTCYDPYYNALKTQADALEARFDRFCHLNMHSMPANENYDIVLGDQFGKSCRPGFIDMLEDAFRAEGITRIMRNYPYAGVELTRVFMDTNRKCDSVQVEINKGLYLSGTVINPVKFARMQNVLKNVMLKAADYTLNVKTPANVLRNARSRSSIVAGTPSAASDVTP